MKKRTTLFSEGVAMSATWYVPPIASGTLNPVIVCCHGWGAPLMAHLEASKLPERLASEGFFVLTFDARGWGESDGVPVLLEPVRQDGVDTLARVRIVRGVLDPLSWITDIRHAIDFVQGEPGVDPNRIGIWGSSFGGGTVLATAALDTRVKCVVSQLGALDMRGTDKDPGAEMPIWTDVELNRLAVDQARTGSFPQHILLSNAIADVMEIEVQPLAINPAIRFFDPIALAANIKVPTLIIDAEHEAYWDINRHGAEAFRRMKAAGNTTADYIVIPGITHELPVYANMGKDGPERELSTHAIRWFKNYL